jgi:hypothetical protein
LSVRSDEAYALARMLAKREQTTATNVILRALRQRAQITSSGADDLPPDLVAENRRRIDQAIGRLWGGLAPPAGQTSRHDDLYDENGL